MNIGHNRMPEGEIEDAVILEDNEVGKLEYFEKIHTWMIETANDILLPNDTRPKYFLKESAYGTRQEGVIYVNFGPREAKLRRNSDDSVTLIEWRNANGKQFKKEAA